MAQTQLLKATTSSTWKTYMMDQKRWIVGLGNSISFRMISSAQLGMDSTSGNHSTRQQKMTTATVMTY